MEINWALHGIAFLRPQTRGILKLCAFTLALRGLKNTANLMALTRRDVLRKPASSGAG